ncbi:TerB family tellurite resistance protein [Methylobacterium sp. J-048]|uniref:TerB family tellurite resistance protein n=1 Tax=Methylobacterium sp. J-048 TaxID=2836635 RepID=UPI001FB935E4|nr:TerB family tellurite resistance protein [Methylobacterium sp. J-048]MCJ2060414.1 TerB family tellurite resistance protein [Methylobacterium sp. J-048]
MPILIVVDGILAAIIFWIIRAHRTVQHLNAIDQDTKGLQRQAKSVLEDVFGTSLERVRDVRLAAIILMLQLVRTGSPVTATEKTRILEFMESPLGITSISAMFERAWRYTQARLPFSQVADPLIPLLRRQLNAAERAELIDMLTKVAGAHSAPSELQREAIGRLKRRLLTQDPNGVTDRRRGFG